MTIRFALIGSGVMGKNHARVISETSNAVLSQVVDIDSAMGMELAQKYKTEWRSRLDLDLGVDAVVVATATETHYEIASEIVSKGIPVLIEKPLTPTIDTAEKLVALSEATNSVLMCGLLERFNPAILLARDLIREPRHILSVRHSPFTPRIKTHVAWDLLIHDLDLVTRFVSSEVVAASTFSVEQIEKHQKRFDVCDAQIEFANRSIATMSTSRISQRKIRTMSITEDDQLFEIDLLRRDVTIYKNVAETFLDERGGYRQEAVLEIPEIVNNSEPLTAQLQHFIKLIDGVEDKRTERDSILLPHRLINDLLTTK